MVGQDPGMMTILLVEDNLGDVFMVREAMAEAGFSHELHVAHDGNEAMAFLREGPCQGGPSLDLMILDLNLPGKNGRQVLAEMQADSDLRDLPVAILTSSHGDSEIGGDFPLVRSTFAVKTADFRELIDILRGFMEFAGKTA